MNVKIKLLIRTVRSIVASLEVEAGSDVSSTGEIEGKIGFCSNIAGFGRIGTGYFKVVLTFGYSTFFLLLEPIIKFKHEKAKVTKRRVFSFFGSLGS
jgi:hypothetical protein